ncbi:hypothetical protein ACC791_37110, partial [Rhizobium ruizarguesonis]
RTPNPEIGIDDVSASLNDRHIIVAAVDDQSADSSLVGPIGSGIVKAAAGDDISTSPYPHRPATDIKGL